LLYLHVNNVVLIIISYHLISVIRFLNFLIKIYSKYNYTTRKYVNNGVICLNKKKIFIDLEEQSLLIDFIQKFNQRNRNINFSIDLIYMKYM
jgi:hypothetical protein